MTLRFLSTAPTHKIKAQLHKTGKLGFSIEAIKKFNLDNSKGLMFAVDDNGSQDEFFALVAPKTTPGALQLKRAGSYLTAYSPSTFNMLGYKYKQENYIFAIEEIDYDGNNVLKFTRRSAIGSKYANK